MLKRMAAEERVAVCLVLRQPSTSIFSMLDHLLLLTNGTLVYSGAPGAAVELYKTFGYSFADPSMNPADWLLDVAQGDVPNNLRQSSDPEQIMQDWRRHESATPSRRCYENVTSGGGTPPKGRSGRSWWAMYTTVLARESILLWRRERGWCCS
jgi:ABC-type multidrug transport system ATPase subunit